MEHYDYINQILTESSLIETIDVSVQTVFDYGCHQRQYTWNCKNDLMRFFFSLNDYILYLS